MFLPSSVPPSFPHSVPPSFPPSSRPGGISVFPAILYKSRRTGYPNWETKRARRPRWGMPMTAGREGGRGGGREGEGEGGKEGGREG
jgi:hypothetical protein